MEQLIKFSSALLTPLIAIIAVYIAYQQMLTNKNKLRNELFDRRMKVFEAFQDFIREVVARGYAETEDIRNLHSVKSNIPFLFDEEIEEYRKSLVDTGLKLRSINRKLSDQSLPKGDKRTELANKDYELNTWFSDQFDESISKFSDYLKIEE
jgi:hypothetical protein